MKYRITYDLSHITNMAALRKEKELVKNRIDNKEKELKNKLYEIPGELAAAGVNSFIPSILRGKITNAALNSGKKVIHALVAPRSSEASNILGSSAKKLALLSILKTGITRLFKK